MKPWLIAGGAALAGAMLIADDVGSLLLGALLGGGAVAADRFRRKDRV